MLQAGILISKANSFRILLGILSGPGAMCVFTRESSFHICDLVTVGGGEAAGLGRMGAYQCPVWVVSSKCY